MEIAIFMLLIVLVALVTLLIRKIRSFGNEKDRLELILNNKFIDFSDRIRSVMEGTRKEVENSKDTLSQSAVKTLEHINLMNTTIQNLLGQQEKVQELGQSLEYLLQAPKLRGSYGETILEELLERVLPQGIWQRQYVIDGGEKVDAVVKYKDVVIPIDSKFPKEDYQKYLAVDDANEKKMHWQNYEKALKVQINSIKTKYIKPDKGTTEFALLFIPSESIYYETIAEKNYIGDPCQIYEYSTMRKVIPVSPNTFYAFLHVVMLGIKNIEIARDARKIQSSLAKVEKDFGLFYNKFELVGKSIDKASDAYKVGDNHVKRFKKNLESVVSFDSSELEKKKDVLSMETVGELGDSE
ncbi:MAG: DNA recombination protein RmuC [Candidatus Omnitrophota bacterium]